MSFFAIFWSWWCTDLAVVGRNFLFFVVVGAFCYVIINICVFFYKSNVCIFFKNFVLVYICRIYIKLRKSYGFWFFILCQIARRGRSCRSSRTDVWYIRIKSVNEYNGSPIDRPQKGQDISCPLRWSDMPEILCRDMGRIWNQWMDPLTVFSLWITDDPQRQYGPWKRSPWRSVHFRRPGYTPPECPDWMDPILNWQESSSYLYFVLREKYHWPTPLA